LKLVGIYTPIGIIKYACFEIVKYDILTKIIDLKINRKEQIKYLCKLFFELKGIGRQKILELYAIGMKEATEIKDWVDCCSKISIIKEYINIGISNPSEIMEWNELGISSLEQLKILKKLGINTLEEYREWNELGISSLEQLKMLMKFDIYLPEEYREWTNILGKNYDLIISWLETDENKCPNSFIKIVKDFNHHGISDPYVYKSWIDNGVKTVMDLKLLKKYGVQSVTDIEATRKDMEEKVKQCLKNKIITLDTNVLMDHPGKVYDFFNSLKLELVLINEVYEELHKFRKGNRNYMINNHKYTEKKIKATDAVTVLNKLDDSGQLTIKNPRKQPDKKAYADIVFLNFIDILKKNPKKKDILLLTSDIDLKLRLNALARKEKVIYKINAISGDFFSGLINGNSSVEIIKNLIYIERKLCRL